MFFYEHSVERSKCQPFFGLCRHNQARSPSDNRGGGSFFSDLGLFSGFENWEFPVAVWRNVDFYHATRMHSADYTMARCLSVCHTPVLSLNGYTYPQSFFTIGQPHYSSFLVPNRMSIFRRGPPNGGVECKGGMKKSRFLTIISLYLWTNAR